MTYVSLAPVWFTIEGFQSAALLEKMVRRHLRSQGLVYISFYFAVQALLRVALKRRSRCLNALLQIMSNLLPINCLPKH
jgi:hypothetical protein